MCNGLRQILARTDKVLSSRGNKDIYIFRGLVHNHQVHKELLERGIKDIINDIDKIPKDSTIIIGPHSAHYKEIEMISQKANVIDTSCNRVQRVINSAIELAKNNDKIVFVGSREHEEAEIIRKHIPNLIVLTSEKEINILPQKEKLGFVCQSTFNSNVYKKIKFEVHLKGLNASFAKSTCKDVVERQIAIEELCHMADIIIVIGGFHSNNTKILTKICKSKNKNTIHIETASELNADLFKNIKTVGITAGASTPDYIIIEIFKKVLAMNRNKKNNFLDQINILQNYMRLSFYTISLYICRIKYKIFTKL